MKSSIEINTYKTTLNCLTAEWRVLLHAYEFVSGMDDYFLSHSFRILLSEYSINERADNINLLAIDESYLQKTGKYLDECPSRKARMIQAEVKFLSEMIETHRQILNSRLADKCKNVA